MAIEQWSEDVALVHLADEPLCTDDLEQIERQAKEKPTDAVLDFSAVHYLTSSNLARLLRIRRHLAAAHRRLILAGISTPVWGTFMVTGIDKMFTRADSVALAMVMVQMEEGSAGKR